MKKMRELRKNERLRRETKELVLEIKVKEVERERERERERGL